MQRVMVISLHLEQAGTAESCCLHSRREPSRRRQDISLEHRQSLREQHGQQPRKCLEEAVYRCPTLEAGGWSCQAAVVCAGIHITPRVRHTGTTDINTDALLQMDPRHTSD
jgi:hypothetical protein